MYMDNHPEDQRITQSYSGPLLYAFFWLMPIPKVVRMRRKIGPIVFWFCLHGRQFLITYRQFLVGYIAIFFHLKQVQPVFQTRNINGFEIIHYKLLVYHFSRKVENAQRSVLWGAADIYGFFGGIRVDFKSEAICDIF